MVHLSRIYTRSGDDGSTGLGDGSRRLKHDLRVATYGTVDELSSVIGVGITQDLSQPIRDLLRGIQNDLFDVGADLCVPGETGDRLRITPAYTKRLEDLIDDHNADLGELHSFILPGGTPGAAWMHMARTVCRRAERLATELASSTEEAADVNGEVVRYLNRLSDLLFVLGRVANKSVDGDVLWVPGANNPDPRE